MSRLRARGLRGLALVVGFLASGAAARGQVLCQTEAGDIAALRSFNQAVAAYVEIHRRLDVGFRSLWIPSDPEVNVLASMRLADAIRFERRSAARGDIFTPEVADLFRVRLAAADPDDLTESGLPSGFDESAQRVPLPPVNSRLMWATSVPLSDTLARVLPVLPLELEYRLAGPALLLVDVSANVVIDVLVDAWP
jgi:hypothetical protein